MTLYDGSDFERDTGLEALEEHHDRGTPWKYPTKPGDDWDPEMPNPLVIRATGVTTGTVNGDELQFLNGVDARGKKWSRIIGSKTLRDVLLDGIVTEWDEDRLAYTEVARVGQVRPGERVAIRFRGFATIKSGPNKGKEIPSLKVERPDAQAGGAQQQTTPEPSGGESAAGNDDDIPFLRLDRYGLEPGHSIRYHR